MGLDPELVGRALEEATRRAENLEYFFENLTSPAWIEPLAARGFFSDPPEQRIDDQGYVRAPGWSASRYLARMAAPAPDAVLDVIRQIQTNNERIHEDFEDAALAMPAGIAREIAGREAGWIAGLDQIYYSLPQKTLALVQHLAEGGEIDAALNLFRALFAPLPDQRDSQWALRHAQARFSDWEYDHLLGQAVTSLVPQAASQLLSALVDLLDGAAEVMKEDPEDAPLSDRLWRPRIASDEHRARNVEDSIVSAIRDAAVASRETGLISDEELALLLSRRDAGILRRILMYALSRPPAASPDVVRPLVMDLAELVDAEPSIEYRDLLRSEAPRLTAGEVAEILMVVEQGPDVERRNELAEKYGGRRLTDDEVDQYVSLWQLGRLRLLGDALPSEWEARRDALVARFGDYDIGVSGEVRTFVGPTSPVSEEQLSDMSDGELVRYLEDWTSDGGWESPTVEGLARAFSVAAERHPARVSTLITRLRDAQPAYVQWALHGLEQAVRRGDEVSWADVLDLSGWVIEQPREHPGGRGDNHDDVEPGWVGTRKEIASLIQAGLDADGTGRIDFEERSRIWRIIAEIASDPDPTPGDEEKYGRTNMDPATLALNTTRPRAIIAAISYARWVLYEMYPEEERRSVSGFMSNEAQEVGELLATHLDPNEDPSEAVRGAIAQRFANLYAMDAGWAVEAALALFPDEPTLLREAAWGSFVIFNAPYNDVLAGLRSAYTRSAELVGANDERFRWMNGDPREALGEHIATFYWRGVVDLNDQLFVTYWSHAGPATRGHFLEFLGRSAHELPFLDPEIVDRLTTLWEAVRDAGDPQPLGAFAWWFASQALPREWRLRQLAVLLEAGISPDPSFIVTEALPTLAPDEPVEATRLLRRLLELEDSPWAVSAWREHVEKVLECALASNNPEARRLVEETANWLGALGYRDYRRFVAQRSLPDQ